MTITHHGPLLAEAKTRTAFYAGIKADVMLVTSGIPTGFVTTFETVGELLNVPRHHVAFLLSITIDPERCEVPWYRVVGKGGALRPTRGDLRLDEQRVLLRREGIIVGPTGIVTQFSKHFFQPTLSLLRRNPS